MTRSGLAPHPLALVICDGLWRDPFTGKWTLIGTFSAIRGPHFPLTHPVLSIYVSLTDGHGKMPVRLELIDTDEDREPVFAIENEVEFPDPTAVVELAFQTTAIQFPQGGEYRLKLFANRNFIVERKIFVGSSEPPPA